jgi:copper(I)-binding protein
MLFRTVFMLLLVGIVAGCGAPSVNTPEARTTPVATSLYVENAWARPSPLPNGNSAVYLTVVNPVDRVDHLLGVSGQLGMTGLHESVTKDNIVSMEPRPDGFEVPPNGSLELAPGGKHVMIMGIAEPLEVGDTVTVTLNFEMYGLMTITVPVEDKPGM